MSRKAKQGSRCALVATTGYIIGKRSLSNCMQMASYK